MRRWIFCLSMLFGLSVLSQPSRTSSRGAGLRDNAGYASDAPLRFRDDTRPYKMIVLGGSIAAYTDHPFARNLHEWCPKLEVRNISKAGLGAHALSKRFDDFFRGQALRAQQNLWLLWNGGLNSVSAYANTNATIAALFDRAHGFGMRVIGVSLTPWGSSGAARWRGYRGMLLAQATRNVVDFLSRDSSADIKVNLYDVPELRDTQAPLMPLEQAKRVLSRDPAWRRRVQRLGPEEKSATLERDALQLQQLPQHWLKKELQGFDYIHPNRDGHTIMARHICRSLPSEFECNCQ